MNVGSTPLPLTDRSQLTTHLELAHWDTWKRAEQVVSKCSAISSSTEADARLSKCFRYPVGYGALFALPPPPHNTRESRWSTWLGSEELGRPTTG